MKEPIYKVSCIVVGSKCAVMRSTSQLVVVFAYPFHFGKSGFSAYFFTSNPDIRILSGFFVQVRIGPYGMVWYGMVNVDLYSAIITKVSNALNTLVSLSLIHI